MNSPSSFPSRAKRLCFALVPAVLLAAAPALHATGGWNTINLLHEYESAAISSPEFWFELEMKELAKEFPVPEKHVLSGADDDEGNEEVMPAEDGKAEGEKAAEDETNGDKAADEKAADEKADPPEAPAPSVAPEKKDEPAPAAAQIEQLETRVKVPAAPGSKPRKPDPNQAMINVVWDEKEGVTLFYQSEDYKGGERMVVLAEALKARSGNNPKFEVIIRADRRTPAKEIHGVMQVAAQATSNISFSTADPPATNEPPAADEKPATPAEALYYKGAVAYHAGKWDDAREAWTALMALPAAERKEQTVAGEYMLGMTEVRANALEKAPAHFAKTRELAATGLPDEEALAAASYGWEAFVWKGTDPEKALTLYLKQLSSGDVRAVTSIKYVMRRHFFGGEMEEAASTAEPPAGTEVWEKAAQSPLLRRVITRWRLAMDADVNSSYAPALEEGEVRKPDPWLALMEKNAPQTEDADRLAWLAYRNGSYEDAARWLKLAPAETRLSLWLAAKLALRAGDVAKASAAMSKTLKLFNEPALLEVSRSEYLPLPPPSAAWGDQAVLLMGQAKFAEALTAFLRACCWEDAAYIAEEVMTLAELKAYVDKNYGSPPALEGECPLDRQTLARVIEIPEPEGKRASTMKLSAEDTALFKEMGAKYILINQANGGSIDTASPVYQNAAAWRIRWLLARRMVREDQQTSARPYFPSEVQPVLDVYLATLKKTQDKKTPAADKARLWWTAAWIARHAGMELMGTEGAPDCAWDEGDNPGFDIARGRFTGVNGRYDPDEPEEEADADAKQTPAPKIKFSVPPTAQEKKRLAKRNAAPLRRFHYRWVATALAKKAAALLKDGTEEKADVLNQAGSWLFDRDVKGEEWFFFEIKRTCPETKIGKQVLANKHTEDLSGPWSGEAEAAEQ